MKTRQVVLTVAGVVALGAFYAVFAPPSVPDLPLPTDAATITRGAYVYNAAGCGSCHQPEGAPAPTGGYVIAVEEPFKNTFHVPNITPDPETGIAGWTGADFLRALKHGRSPSGGFYWPAFPYRSYKEMTDEDVLAVGAYLMSLAPVRAEVPDHELPAWQFDWLMAGWNLMASVLEGSPPPVESTEPAVQRGAYLARALGHCGECHTPRNGLGMMQLAQEFGGVPENGPQINAEGLSDWAVDDFRALLQLGMTPDFETVGGEMAHVIEHTSKLTPEDQDAYVAFFMR
ncbi:MAG: c-type cytochrome [Pseudohongiellaceae bacterium]